MTNAQVAAIAASTRSDKFTTADLWDEWFDHILSKLNNLPVIHDERTFGDA